MSTSSRINETLLSRVNVCGNVTLLSRVEVSVSEATVSILVLFANDTLLLIAPAAAPAAQINSAYCGPRRSEKQMRAEKHRRQK